MKMRVRNPALYTFLDTRVRGGVKVVKAGQECRYVTRQTEHGLEITISDGGEEYAICCPICGDTRYRCYVNHMLGRVIKGAKVLHTVHCWNEECQQDGKLYRALVEPFEQWKAQRFIGDIQAPESTQPQQVMSTDDYARESYERHEKLTGVRQLGGLLPGHPATAYLQSRGYDVAELADTFRVGYKGKSQRRSYANGRLIIPITWKSIPVGWQARVIPGHTDLTAPPERVGKDWPYKEPKYFTSPGFTKGRFLYNVDVARNIPGVIVVVEGVTDVWRVGPFSVAMLGKSLSYDQIRILVEEATPTAKYIVLFSDAWTAPDVERSWRKNKADLMNAYQYKDRVLMIKSDTGDPGDMSREDTQRKLHNAVYNREGLVI